MKIKGAKIVIECLLEQGVDTVFGYPGVSIIDIYDELFKYQDKITHILTAHEQGAAHAADGYARVSDKPGVCLATSGPGATNLITGMAAAFMDSSPVIFITCNVPDSLLGKDAFQEVDIVGIAMPITKNTYLVRRAEDLADTIREAFALAVSGRKGPVLIDITANAVREYAEYTPMDPQNYLKKVFAYRRNISHIEKTFSTEELKKAKAILESAKCPLVLAGGGVVWSKAEEQLKNFAAKIDAPIVSTMMGLGTVSSKDENFLGMLGSYGEAAAEWACKNCDLLIAVGVRFSDRVTGRIDTFAPKAKKFHIDIDRAEIDKNVPADYYIVGDAAHVLEGLTPHISQQDHEEWKLLARHKKIDEKEWRKSSKLTALAVMGVIREITDENTRFVTDVGQHQIWASTMLPHNYPRQFITSGGYGAMGFGLGASIGAKIADASKTVLHITGDGSFRMNCTELATEYRYKVPIITVVINNHSLGLVKQRQHRDFENRIFQTLLDDRPDFAALAMAYGIPGVKVKNEEELRQALKSAVASKAGCVIECTISPMEEVKVRFGRKRN